MLSRILEPGAEVKAISPSRRIQMTGAIRHHTQSQSEDQIAQLRAELAATSTRAEQAIRDAYLTGKREGETAAREQMQTQLAEALNQTAQSVAALAQGRADAIRQAEPDILRMVLLVCSRILHRELTVNPAAVESLAHAAVEKLQGLEILRVRVHGQHEQAVKKVLVLAGRADNVAVSTDALQPLGAVVFELTRGSLDASVFTQLDEIERSLDISTETNRA